MVAHLTQVTEHERGFLQQRVALFGKVMFGIMMLGSVLEILAGIGTHERLTNPFMGMLVLATGSSAGVWLLCRRGARSAIFSRLAEATGLLIYTLAMLVLGRFVLVMIVPMITGGMGLTDPPSPTLGPHFLTALQLYQVLVMVVLLTHCFVVRAALVPSPPRYTAAITAAAGVPLALITATGVPGLRLERLIAANAAPGAALQAAAVAALWWMFTVIVCTVISRVIYGLRLEVREARQLGQYTLEQKLGEGGMGIVYRARHAMMRRPTAVKLLPPNRAGEADLARFEREVQLTAELSHPNTITIYDYGRTPDGVFYYAMELLDGATLEAIVEDDGAQPAGRVIHVLTQVGSALQEAHGVDFVHRDIKPANIILCDQGGQVDVAKLLDFGLVKTLSRREQEQPGLTHDGTVTGTPLYMAPEHLTAPDAADHRSDLYALGAVGYFLLTGTHVFSGATIVEVCSHHLHSDPEPPSARLGRTVDAELEALILRCLRKDPVDRPATAAELVEALAACPSAGGWTESGARQWWDEHGEGLRPRASRTGGSSTHTLAVDLRRLHPE